jgi:orotidine-5'-phosphate decarboxylase
MKLAPKLKSPWFLALDVDDIDQARSLARQAAPYVGGFKLGPRLCLRFGSSLIEELSQIAPVFVDQKFFDIPSTMESAVRAAHACGANFVTIHALAGKEALMALAKVEAELNEVRPLQILAVTMLTSFTSQGLPPVLRDWPIATHVESLADLVFSSGLSGVVCSSEEVTSLRRKYPNAFLLVPGIRLSGGGTHDQKRVATPKSAMASGASALVIGRPVLEAPVPHEMAKQIFSDLAQAGQ